MKRDLRLSVCTLSVCVCVPRADDWLARLLCCVVSCRALLQSTQPARPMLNSAVVSAAVSSGEQKSDSTAPLTAKVLTVPHFYHLFHYITQNAPIMQHARARLRRLQQQQQQEAADSSDGGSVAESDDSRVCSICLSADVQVALPCLHAFCSACIEDWHTHDRSASCPLCRSNADVNGADVWRLDGGSETELREMCDTIASFPHHYLHDKPDWVD